VFKISYRVRSTCFSGEAVFSYFRTFPHLKFHAVKNVGSGGILQSTSLYFALRAILQMFKMVAY
jgi:hypothetical protein